jgi:hypothetical protein
VQLAIDEILQNAHDFNPRKPMTDDLRPAIEALLGAHLTRSDVTELARILDEQRAKRRF